MNTKFSLVFIILLIINLHASGQEISFRDTVKTYNKARVIIDVRGMMAEEAFGLADIVGGSIGYYSAKDKGAKYFWQMDAFCGVIDLGMGALGIVRAKRQAAEKLDIKKAWQEYQKDRRYYLTNMAIDALFAAGGAGLTQYGNTDKNTPQLDKGYGKSLVLQGIVLLVFDNILLASQQKYNSRWRQILDEMSISGNGIGFNFR